jgi:hypothetical protein
VAAAACLAAARLAVRAARALTRLSKRIYFSSCGVCLGAAGVFAAFLTAGFGFGVSATVAVSAVLDLRGIFRT